MNGELDAPSLIDIAYTKAKDDIAEGRLMPGSKIIIRELSERYGISGTPIKQALNRLITEGFVESIPRRGMRVKKVSWAEINDILDFRLMMDLYFVKTVILTLDGNTEVQDRFRGNITENLDYAKNSANLSEYQRVYRLDQQFHGLYIECSGNTKAIQVYSTLNTHAYSTYLYGKQPREKTISGVVEHQMIFDSLREGDEEKARSFLRLHSQNAREKIYHTLKTTHSI